MKKIVLMLFFLTVLFAQTTSTILRVEGNKAKIDLTQAAPGTSGIVIHHYDTNHSSIVARAIVEAPDTIRFEVFDALAQDALPRPTTKPQKGDTVILGYLYDRATIIAPNFATYQKIENSVEGIALVHPDIFATELSKAHRPAPTYEDFKNFCNKFALAKIYLALKNRTDIVDCYSFTPLGSLAIKAEGNETKLPFYTRIKEIETSIFDFFGPKNIQNYYSYYEKMERK